MYGDCRHIPKIGDLVNYKDELMVIVCIETLSIIGDRIAYLLNKELMENFKDFTEIENLTSKCTLQRYDNISRYYPFSYVGTLPIEIHQKSYIKITLKE